MNDKDEKVQVKENTSGQGKLTVVPQELMRWNWGAFFLNWIWAISNNVWIGLLSLIPWVGVVMAIILGMKGNGWAWQNKRWDGIEQFRKTQRNWTKWGVILVITLFVLGGVGAALIIPNAGRLIYGETAEANVERNTVQNAVRACMKNHGLEALPHPVTVATNDMSVFPDAKSVAGSVDKQTMNGQKYRSGDKNGYTLFQDDSIADGMTANLFDYIPKRFTKGTYIVDQFGWVTQVTTGYK